MHGSRSYYVRDLTLDVTGLTATTDFIDIDGTKHALTDVDVGSKKAAADFIASKLSNSDYTITANDDGTQLTYTANTAGAVGTGQGLSAAPTTPSISFVSGYKEAEKAHYEFDLTLTLTDLDCTSSVKIGSNYYSLAELGAVD